MSIESTLSGHWTDDQLIEHLYDLGPQDGHLEKCADCASRLSAMQAQRQMMDVPLQDAVSHEFLAAQRRAIYAKLSERQPWWKLVPMRQAMSAAAMLLVLGGSLVVYEHKQEREMSRAKISDAQLAQEVSSMAFDSEPQSTAPLQALFVEND